MRVMPHFPIAATDVALFAATFRDVGSFRCYVSHLVAAQDLAGWDDQPLSAFPDGTWQPVVSAPAVRVPDTALAPVQMPPIRIVETRRAVSIRKIDQATTSTNDACC